MARSPNKMKTEKKVTRYMYDDIKETRTPETGHTSLLPAEEQVVTLPMDNGWSKAIEVGKLAEGDERPVVVDMDPAADPVLFWAGKRNRREVPVLPLQRNEIVSESRIAQIIERARRAVEERSGAARQGYLFADLERTLREGDRAKRVEFYTHDEGWKNKLICGDSLHVMASLLHYENLRGKVQMIYIDPPYGIKYDSNFQQRVDSTKNDEKDAADDVLTIKAFRDTWALGIHSYVAYLQERLYLCRELLRDSGSLFVQISDQNVHLVRALLDEVFGRQGFCSQITFQKTGSQETALLGTTVDYLLWYAKNRGAVSEHYRQLYLPRKAGDLSLDRYDHIELLDGTVRRLTAAELRGDLPIPEGRRFRTTSLLSDGETGTPQDFEFGGKVYRPRSGNHWKTPPSRLKQLAELGRIRPIEARHQPKLHGITAGSEYHWNRGGRGFGSDVGRSAGGGNDSDLTLHQVICQFRQAIVLAIRPAIFDCDVLAFDIAGLFEALPKGTDVRRIAVGR
jgi:DNA methylase